MLDPAATPRPHLALRVGGALSCLLLGAVTGTIGTFAHQSMWTVLSLRLPLGAIAALAAVGLLVAGLRLALGGRAYAALAALGVVAAVGLFALPGPSGSALLPANPAGYAWTLGPTLLSAVILAWPVPPPRDDSEPWRTRWDTGGGEGGTE